MPTLEKAIKKLIKGEARFDDLSCQIYSVDASIYEVKPLGIVYPKDIEDILAVLQIAQQRNLSIIPRGAGTGITGGCLGKGIILDTSKFMNKILKIDFENETAECQPGVVQDDLNDALAPKGYRLGPDTSTGNRATLGGMAANNSAGSRSLLYGKMVDSVVEIDIALASGNVATFKEVTDPQWAALRNEKSPLGNIYRTVYEIKSKYAADIEKHFPKIPRRVSGYNLDELIKPHPLNIAKLIVGSEGSLGVITRIKTKIARKPPAAALCLICYDTLSEAMKSAEEILSLNPIALEMLDDKIIQAGKHSPSLRGKLSWLTASPKVLFAAEFSGNSQEEAKEKAENCALHLSRKSIGSHRFILNDPATMNSLWDLRKAGLGLLLSKRSYSRAIAFLEDLSVGPAHLDQFIEQFFTLLRSAGKDAGIYGHAGSGCMHIRPYIDLRSPAETTLMQTLMLKTADLLLENGGALSGEHGDGLVRSWLNKKMFGDKVYEAFLELKNAFDPENRMNPGKVVNGPPLLENLRLSPETPIRKIDTFLDFSPEGGFELAADLCNGNGLCRKKQKVMCPSFQATGDEWHTTRARAQSLRAIIHGQLPLESMASQEIYDVLDLCLECKGCKTECPSEVDMAKMKAEFLYHFQKKHGYPLRSRLFGSIGDLNKIGSFFPGFFNLIVDLKGFKKMLGAFGIAQERSLPKLAPLKFSSWLKKQPQQSSGGLPKVVLFNDTFTEYNHPAVGAAAFKLLKKLGYDVIVPSWSCCGRPLISKGLLEKARTKAEALLDILYPLAAGGIPIIGLEPSCILTIYDDYNGLIAAGNTAAKTAAQAVSKVCVTLDQFLSASLQNGTLPLPFQEGKKEILVHGHCYQKSLTGMNPTMNVLKAIPDAYVQEIDSGCCGMAGSFGYEKEHYGISMKIGELRLLPAVRKASPGCTVIASGTSCRSQILQGTERQALHLAEALSRWIL